jgi:outer membrane receptor protein involved in Fe transport
MISTVVLCAFAFASQNTVPAQLVVRGVVVDASGSAVAGARVMTRSAAAITDQTGQFVVAIPAGSGALELRVQARGFSDYAAVVRGTTTIRVVLQPQGVTESVTVTAARSDSALGGSAAPSSVLLGSSLLTSGAGAIDDALREVPGFSLFRRSSSRIANPTTQGASLRGLSASGASRALALADGVPLNDPFGGWVYWDRVPRAAVDRIETVRGGATLYGAEAIAGVVQLFTIRPARPAVRLEAEGGNLGMGRASTYGGAAPRGWNLFASGERMVFDGAHVVAESDRGAVDTRAGVDYWSSLANAGYSGGSWNINAQGGWLREDRANGTPLQTNDTNLWHVAGRTNVVHGRGVWTASGYGGRTIYHQSFSAVNQQRTAERLTSRQAIRSDYGGGGLQWAGGWARAHLLAGAEAKRVGAQSDETMYSPVGGADIAVGEQRTPAVEHDYAAYGQLSSELSSSVAITVAARGELWSTDQPVMGGDSHRIGLFMPRASLTWSARPWISLHASWTNPARTPTLNELYRNFRVGSVFTQSNSALSPENANSMEAGALLRAGRAIFRATGFWTRVTDAITNVTQASGPTLIVRKRLNAGVIRARGAELEAEWRASRLVAFTATAAAYDSTFTESTEPGLAGNRVPQVPRWSTALSARAAGAWGAATMTWKAVSPQFDDDRNQFRLRSGQTLDAYVGKQVRAVQLYVTVENLFDAQIETGRTPVTTMGLPRTLRAGLRLLLP